MFLHLSGDRSPIPSLPPSIPYPLGDLSLLFCQGGQLEKVVPCRASRGLERTCHVPVSPFLGLLLRTDTIPAPKEPAFQQDRWTCPPAPGR